MQSTRSLGVALGVGALVLAAGTVGALALADDAASGGPTADGTTTDDGTDASGDGKAKRTGDGDGTAKATAEPNNGTPADTEPDDTATRNGDTGGDGGDSGDGKAKRPTDGDGADGGNGKVKVGDEGGGDGAAGPSIPGLVTVESDRSANATVERITGAIEANENLGLAAVVDHQANAASVGMDLRSTTVILFGNPALGTPLMQDSRQTGIDLPQKLLVYDDGDGQVRVGFNDPGYLAARHDVTSEDATLNTIAGALSTLAGGPGTSTDADATADPATEELLAGGDGVETVESDRSVNATVERIRGTLDERGFGVPLVLDHRANAASVGMDLRPTTVIVFGNPAVGTPLLQASQTVGIDLPQKILVYEDSTGQVRVAYNDPAYLAARHGVTGQDERLEAIEGALQGITTGEAGNGSSGT
jgi:uncharacterized protein (DUF302 family)